MSTRAKSEQPIPAPARRHTVVMGRQDFFSVVLRLIGVELYKLRCRTMSKALSTIAILSLILVFFLIAVSTNTSDTASSLAPGEQVQTAAEKQAELAMISAPLRLPNSLITSVEVINYAGLVLIIILAGTIVGGEYAVGTIRLMFTRGPTRTQFLLSKVGAIFVCTVLGTFALALIGIVVGAFFNIVMKGISTNFSFFTGTWVLHASLYLLAAALGLFLYGMIALCLSLLGKTTVAGVAGALMWWVLEGLLGQVFYLLGTLNRGILGDFLKAVRDYLIGNNVQALLQNQTHYLVGDSASQLSDLHTLFVLVFYIILLVGLAWWVNERRDVTN
ncbi:MAG: ABC transporter permease subunit [Chloroflexi bacterium]|nr:ABC transporter permease subunit [Chloroflexota bacterium]